MNRILLIAFTLFTSTLAAQSWVSRANTPVVMHHPITFSLNGKGYAVTGTGTNNLPTNAVYDYNPTINTWGTLPNFPGAARGFGIGAEANGFGYIGFGSSTTNLLRDLWRFDPSDSSWTQLANCGCTGRRHPAMIAIGNKIYVGLGSDAFGDKNDWWMYDITLNTWTQIANLPGLPRHHPFMFNIGSDVFAGLGHGGRVIYRDWYKLDTATNTWTTMNNHPGQARVAGTQFSTNGKGYVLSGDGSNHSWMSTGEMWEYDAAADSWTQLTAHPGTSRWAPGSFVINDTVYFFGGLNRFTNSFPNDMWRFSLNQTTSVNELESESISTFVYPNPANNVLNLESDLNITEVRIYNMTGQLFMTSPAETNRLNIDNLNQGLYLVQFYKDNELISTSKVMIQR